MKVALYTRVSTDKQSKGLEAQKHALNEYCRSKGIEDFEIYADFGISGAKVSRPELDRLMNDVKSGQIKTVVVYSFSRFARSTKHLLEGLEEFKRRGVGFVSITENLDTSTAIGTALFTIISAISQLERELIAERVKNGLANAKAKGKRLGRPKLRPSELIRELSVKGFTYRQIAKLAKISVSTVSEELNEVRSEIDDTEQDRVIA